MNEINKAKEVVTDVKRKPWIKRQQNILMLLGLAFCAVGALTGIINQQLEAVITSVIVAGATIIGGVSSESLRDKNKFEAAAFLLNLAANESEKPVEK